MEECQKCGCAMDNEEICSECGGNTEEVMFETIMEIMGEKVMKYKDVMHERLQIIREDITSSITEETIKYQKLLNSSLNTLNDYMAELSELEIPEGETKRILHPDIVLNSLEIRNIKFNLNTQEIHEGFLAVMRGEFIIFREIFRSSNN